MHLFKLPTRNVIFRITEKHYIVKVPYRNFKDVSNDDIGQVSQASIKKFLKTSDLGFEEGFTCFLTKCLNCQKSKKSNLKLYINKMTGMHMCSNCKKTGSWEHFTSCLVSKSTTKEKVFVQVDKLKDSLLKLRDKSNPIDSFSEEEFLQVLKAFNLPNIEKTSVKHLDIRLNKDNNQLLFPLENVENEVVGFRVLKLKGREEIYPDESYGGLLTHRMPKSKEMAVLVPNISDFLVLLNNRISANIICMPKGISSISQYFLPSLERFKKLVLWLGNDITAWESAKQFAKKLGEERCLFIRPNPANDLPHNNTEADFKAIIGFAQPIRHKSITTFSSLRAEIFSDLQNIDKVEGVKWTRFPSLNKILKGHRRGELTVFTGPTGSGKTTFMSEYSLDLAMQGVNTLWGSFEIRNSRLGRTMLQQMSGVSLEDNLDLFDQFADEFEKLPIYFMTFHGQHSIKVVMDAIEHATYIYDIAHVIIDNVQFMMGMTEEQRHMDRFWKQDSLIAAFRTFATRRNCHVTLVIHPRKEREEELTTSSIFGGAKASQESDNILIMQDKRLTSIRGKKYLQIAKNRYSGDLGVLPLHFHKESLSFMQNRKADKDISQDDKSDL